MNEKCGQDNMKAEDQIDEEKLIRQLIDKKKREIKDK